jgi:hypothetical protein
MMVDSVAVACKTSPVEIGNTAPDVIVSFLPTERELPLRGSEKIRRRMSSEARARRSVAQASVERA